MEEPHFNSLQPSVELKVEGLRTQMVLDARSRNVVKRQWETSVDGSCWDLLKAIREI